jgi:alkyldihydroxyacetonephosphate synthase
MKIHKTGSRRNALRFWGWGYADESLTPDEETLIESMASNLSAEGLVQSSEPKIADFDLPPPRITLPDSLSEHVSASAYDRLVHTYGKSYADMVRMFLRDTPNVPDAVAFPRSEQDIIDLLDWANSHSVAVIPFGGGTSVCGGVEADVGDHYAATLSLDLQYLGKVLEIDYTSRAARIEGGAFGPDIEAALRPHELTLRHFPQSFQFSTLGGWIATRAGGHFASVYTHIDDFVESTRMVTPKGVMESRRLPGSGAGPSPDRMVIGSEGTLGVITAAWMRLQDRPVFRASASVTFDDFSKAVESVRALSQSGLFPSNCRLLDPMEGSLNRIGDGLESILVLGFESADHPLQAWMDRALELVMDYGGRFDADAVRRSQEIQSSNRTAEHQSSIADDWRNAFIRMPYYRNHLTPLGIIADTFETAVTWDKFDALYHGVKEQVGSVLEKVTEAPAILSCRFTHIYPDGPAPYFTFYAVGTSQGDLTSALARWREIKWAANQAVVDHGGTVTHHHAVGRDHRSGYEQQSPTIYRQALAAAKHSLDPSGILNPGVLIDPVGKAVGITGSTIDT